MDLGKLMFFCGHLYQISGNNKTVEDFFFKFIGDEPSSGFVFILCIWMFCLYMSLQSRIIYFSSQFLGLGTFNRRTSLWQTGCK